MTDFSSSSSTSSSTDIHINSTVNADKGVFESDAHVLSVLLVASFNI